MLEKYSIDHIFQGVNETRWVEWMNGKGYSVEEPALTTGLHEFSRVIYQCKEGHTDQERLHRIVWRGTRPQANCICDECAGRKKRQPVINKYLIKYSRAAFVQRCDDAGDDADPMIYLLELQGTGLMKAGKLGTMPLDKRREIIEEDAGYKTDILAIFRGWHEQVHFAEVALQRILAPYKAQPARPFKGSEGEVFKLEEAMKTLNERLASRWRSARLLHFN